MKTGGRFILIDRPGMNGGEQLFLSLLRPRWQRLHAVARHYTRSDQDAQDLVQEALMRAWRNFSPSAGKVYEAGWLFTILRNVAREWQRSAASKVRLTLMPDTQLTEMLASDPGEPLAQLPALSEQAFRQFLDDHTVAAFDALPAAYREVLVLSVAGGLEYHEIADVLECPIGTVMSRIARARRMLRESLSGHPAARSAKSEGRA